MSSDATTSTPRRGFADRILRRGPLEAIATKPLFDGIHVALVPNEQTDHGVLWDPLQPHTQQILREIGTLPATPNTLIEHSSHRAPHALRVADLPQLES